MKAMILAAGRGSRMLALTEKKPKPLLMVAGKPLIEHQIIKLKQAGVTDIVVNLGYLGQQIKDYLGDGTRYAVDIAYSTEPQAGLETGGGVFQALKLLGGSPFILVNADVFSDYNYAKLLEVSPDTIHLVLVDNPEFKNEGDFGLQLSQLTDESALTFSGISVVNPCIFSTESAGVYSIIPLFKKAIKRGLATGEHYTGLWRDVGTPQRLLEINKEVGSNARF